MLCQFSAAIIAPLFAICLAAGSAPVATAPNELGKVLILEYHLIQPEETRWGRAIANFRHDLEALYVSGYRPIGMDEYISGRIPIPEGTRPVLFTFDDSSPGQFRYIERGGKHEIDPDCAVGMLVAFHTAHPDFRLRGIFFVLPGAKEPHKLFGQPEYETEKLRSLVSLGFEIGNHTLWHADLSKYDASVVQKQLAMAVKEISSRVPGYLPHALALPLGMYPKDAGLAERGNSGGISYRNDAILMVAGGPAPSPFSTGRNLQRVPRLQVTGGALEGAVKRLAGDGFVSDGEEDRVTIPRALEPQLDKARLSGMRLSVY
jgi:hypothetical protein